MDRGGETDVVSQLRTDRRRGEPEGGMRDEGEGVGRKRGRIKEREKMWGF